MKCNNALDIYYEAENGISLQKRLTLALHIVFCRPCTMHIGKYEEARSLLQTGFFPPSPDFSNSIMNAITSEAIETEDISVFESGGFSTKGWIIAGIVMFLSFVTVFFGQDFNHIAKDLGSSFLLPLGIIIGTVLSVYGALFIGSHLKELSQRFKL